jgi:hypothetical protein
MMRDWIDQGLGWLRATNRHARLRIAIVGAWAAVSLLTVVLTCPPPGPDNALGAEVHVRDSSESFVGGTQVLVRNASGEMWRDVVITLGDGWRYAVPALRPGEQVVVAAAQFRRGTEAFPRDHRPRRLLVAADRGRHLVEWR